MPIHSLLPLSSHPHYRPSDQRGAVFAIARLLLQAPVFHMPAPQTGTIHASVTRTGTIQAPAPRTGTIQAPAPRPPLLWLLALVLALASAGQGRADTIEVRHHHEGHRFPAAVDQQHGRDSGQDQRSGTLPDQAQLQEPSLRGAGHAGQPGVTRLCAPLEPSLTLSVGQSQHLRLLARTERVRWNARPAVASVQASPGGMHWVRALAAGSTEVEFLFDADNDTPPAADAIDAAAASCQRLRIEVVEDLAVPRSLIQAWIASLARDPLLAPPRVVLEARGDLLVLQGEVARAEQAQALEALLRTWMDTLGGRRLHVLNWVRVRPPEQVMLEVRIAEVTSRLLDKLGVDWSIGRQSPVRSRLGQWSAEAGFANAGAALLSLMRGSGLVSIDAEALRSEWRLLAQPNLMAQSGMEGQFLAGGKVFIPVSIQQGQGEQLSVTTRLDEREYGVSLKFTPTVLADGRVQLKVAPEVSELSREGVLISAGERGAVLPLVTLRKASTTITLADGESFVVGGLLSQGSEERRRGIPGVVDLPLLGALFGARDTHGNRTELVFIVTPRRVVPALAGAQPGPRSMGEAP